MQPLLAPLLTLSWLLLLACGAAFACIFLPRALESPRGALKGLWKAFIFFLGVVIPCMAAVMAALLAGGSVTLAAWLLPAGSSGALRSVLLLIRRGTYWPTLCTGLYCTAATGWVLFWTLRSFLMRAAGREARELLGLVALAAVAWAAWHALPLLMQAYRMLRASKAV